MYSRNITYIARVDHLRFFAGALVAAYHCGFSTIPVTTANPVLQVIAEGETGVGLFMVLSGFILTTIVGKNSVNYGSFLFNRLLRIYPLYLVTIVVAAYLGGRTMDFQSLTALLFFAGNLGKVAYPQFPHMWIVAVELQFYLIFPLLVFFATKYGSRYLVAAVLLSIAIRAMIFVLLGSVQDAAYWTILGRIDQFLIGIGAAALYSRRLKVFSITGGPVLALILLWAAIYLFRLWCGGYHGAASASSPAWIIESPIEAAIWALLILSYLQQKWAFATWLDRTLSFLGTISFSTYVWHFWIIGIFAKLFPQWSSGPHWEIFFVFVTCPAIVGLGTISYFVIERPFLPLRRNYIRQRADPSAADLEVRAVA